MLVGLVGVGCQAPPTPVLLEPGEKVIGRARDATRVRLLTTSGRLITVQLPGGSTSSEVLHGLTSGETPWVWRWQGKGDGGRLCARPSLQRSTNGAGSWVA